MKTKTLITLILFISIFLFFGSYIYDRFKCKLCDGNTDKIVKVNYKECIAEFKLYGEKTIFTSKLAGINSDIGEEKCKCIFDSFLDNSYKSPIIIENGFVVKKTKNGVEIYVETLDNELILWNKVIENNMDNICKDISTWNILGKEGENK